MRPKGCTYLTDGSDKTKKAKDKMKCVIKQKLKFEDYKSCLEPTQRENQIN